jgi:hypothetical protein
VPHTGTGRARPDCLDTVIVHAEPAITDAVRDLPDTYWRVRSS